MMHTENACARNEVAFDEIATTDVILIQTLNSLYRFSVTDPNIFQGDLLGGPFKENSIEAVLCAPKLSVGFSARLFIGSGDDHKMLRTSRVISLTHIKND